MRCDSGYIQGLNAVGECRKHAFGRCECPFFLCARCLRAQPAFSSLRLSLTSLVRPSCLAIYLIGSPLTLWPAESRFPLPKSTALLELAKSTALRKLAESTALSDSTMSSPMPPSAEEAPPSCMCPDSLAPATASHTDKPPDYASLQSWPPDAWCDYDMTSFMPPPFSVAIHGANPACMYSNHLQAPVLTV